MGPRLRVALATIALATAALTPAALTPVGPVGADGNEVPGSPGLSTSITAGLDHTCVRTASGSLRCWGRNQAGQLGHGDTRNLGDDPGEIRSELLAVPLGTRRAALATSAGAAHTCAILDGGTLKCWGNGGVLGDGANTTRGDEPGEMGDALPAAALGSGHTATAVTGGSGHGCAVDDAAGLWCWGNGFQGQLGTGSVSIYFSPVPVSLGTGRTVETVSAGDNHTCALLDDGRLKCWGLGGSGRLGITVPGANANAGDAPGEMGDALPAVDLGTGRTAIAVSAGSRHTCALLDDATVKCWGDNQYGQLGLGDTDDRGDTPGEMGDALAIVPVTASAVEGTVSTPESDPLTGVLVAVLRADDLTLAAAVGDTDSSFTVDVAPGQYFLYVIEATGAYQSGWHGSPTPVTVDAGQTTSVELVPPRARGAVTGTVTETGTGAPLAGVWAVSLATSTGGVERVVATGPGGQYAIDEVAAGSHLLAFVDPAGGHASRFHPDAPAAPGATPVVVAPGAATTADGTLPSQSVPGHGAALSGTVRESGTGAPLADVRVVALRSSDFTMARGTTTNAAGNYTLNVPLGQAFRVAFLDPAGAHASEWYDDQPGTSLATSVAVTSPATAHASLERTTGRLDGTVTRSGGAPAAGVWAVAVGADGVAGAATTGADGGYELAPLSAGTYRVAFVDPATAHTEYWLDAPDHATASVFVIDAGHTTTIDADLGP